MSTMTLMNEGLNELWNAALAAHVNPTIELALYTDNESPSATKTWAGDFTECALSGYARKTVQSMTWHGVAASGDLDSYADAVTFNFSAYGGGTTIYGCAFLITAGGSAKAIGAKLLDTPYAVPSGGGFLVLTPKWKTGPHA